MINEQSVATLSFDRSWCATSHPFPKLRSGYQLPRKRNLRIFTISFATLFGFCCRWGSQESSGNGGGTKCATVFTRNCKVCCYSFASCILMVSIDGCKHLCILRDIDCKINGTVNHQSKALIYKMPEATRTCVIYQIVSSANAGFKVALEISVVLSCVSRILASALP